jgi:lysyl-tRNA synthetase class 2
MGREEEIINERLRKLDEIIKKGIEPYPHNFHKEKNFSDIQGKYSKLKNDERTKDSVKTAGRVMTIRDMGNLIFATLQDGTGKIQIVMQNKETPEKVFNFFKDYVDSGDFVGVEGTIFKTKRGEVSILVRDVKMLSKSILPLPEKWHGLSDKEERYRKRYLDLIMNPEVKKVFEIREKIIDETKKLLKEEGFLEVETPILQAIYGGASAKPFTTHLNALDMKLFLSISPELYLKRLIVGGYEKVFTICKNFRNEGIDAFHNPEFTMLEYYVAYKNYEYHFSFAEKLFERLKKALNLREEIEYQGKKIKIKTPFPRITFRDLLIKEIGIDINRFNSLEKLKKEIKKKNLKEVNISGCKHYGALLDELYKRIARPRIIQPTFLTHYPSEMIALAKKNEEDKSKINTLQLIVDGAEIIKAYDELNDPVEQEIRLREQAKLLKKGESEAMPMDEDFITALKIGMPPTAGYGMGIDRLAMLFTNSPSVRDVIFFPFMKPEEGNKIQVKENKTDK